MTGTLREFRQAVEGAVCAGLVAQAYGYNGELVSPTTVLFLAFAPARWARFGIDGGHFHWRETASLEPIPGDGSGNTYPLVDLASRFPVVGQRIATVVFAHEAPDEAMLRLTCDGGGVLTVVNHGDQTFVKYLAPAV